MTEKEKLQEVKEYIKYFADAMELDDLNKFLNDVQNFYDNGYFHWLYERADRVNSLENCVFELMKSLKDHDDDLKKQKEYNKHLEKQIVNEVDLAVSQ